MLLTNVGIHLLVVPAGILFLSFSKWYVICDAANPSISFGIFLRHLDRNANWHRCERSRRTSRVSQTGGSLVTVSNRLLSSDSRRSESRLKTSRGEHTGGANVAGALSSWNGWKRCLLRPSVAVVRNQPTFRLLLDVDYAGILFE